MGPALALAIALTVAPDLLGQAEAKERALSAEDVIKAWTPDRKLVTDYNEFGGSPEKNADVAAFSFRAIGPSYEQLWNFYADQCGMKQRYAEKTMLVSPGTGPKGSYVVADIAATDRASKATSVFLLKTDQYTVTATIHPNSDGKSIGGSLTVVMRGR